MRDERVYLDHNATTPLRDEVRGAMLPWLGDRFGNPSSQHSFGREARAAVEAARDEVAALIGAEPSEIVFTSGATEADNLALVGMIEAGAESGRTGIVVSSVEHEAVLATAAHLRKFRGCEVVTLPVDRNGSLDVAAFDAALTPEVALVSVMHANNETGIVSPIRGMAARCRDRGIPFHTDAVQTVGRVMVNVRELGVDLLSLSAHKFHGPKGVGALYVRAGTKLVPQSRGGAHERGMRSGTENVAGIVGLGAACRLARESMAADAERIRNLRDALERRIADSVPDVTVNGRGAERLPGTLNVTFDGATGEDIVMALDLDGIAVSTGSACTSGAFLPSHVLIAMGRSEREARSAVRFSFGRDNTDADVGRVMAVLPGIVERARAFSMAEV